MKSSFEMYCSSAPRTTIKWSKPTAEARRPQTKICKYHLRWPVHSNRAGCKQDQTELRVRYFSLPQNRIGNFADQSKTNRGRIVPLHIHERLDQFALIDANKLPGFPLEIPNPNIRQHLQGRSKAALRKPCSARN